MYLLTVRVCVLICSVSTRMVDTRRDLLARESVMLDVLLL